MREGTVTSLLIAAALIAGTPSWLTTGGIQPATEGRELPVRRIPNLGPAAEPYFSPDGRSLICNAKLADDDAYHVYTLGVDGTNIRRINDKGQDACSFFFPDARRLIWTSTRDRLDLPPGNWSDANDYPRGAELYTSNPDGSDVRRLTANEYYDGEVTVSPDGKWIVFSRQIDGRIDLWRMRPDGSEQKQITHTPDWQEGGSQYMPDAETLVYRAWKLQDQDKRGMPMTIFTIKHDGSGVRQITTEEGTNWSPYPAPDGKHFAFVKLLERGNFEIFLMDLETRTQTRLTHNEAFDGFPAISPDGRTMAFASNRDAAPGERTLYLHTMDISSLNLSSGKK